MPLIYIPTMPAKTFRTGFLYGKIQRIEPEIKGWYLIVGPTPVQDTS